MTPSRKMELALCAFALAFVLVMSGFIFVVEVPFYLAFGWGWFLWQVAQYSKANWPGVLTGILATGLLAILAHRFLGWFWQEFKKQSWRPRWTVVAVSLLGIGFAAGMSMIGLVHQISWLYEEPAGIVHNRVGSFVMVGAKAALNESGRTATSNAVRRRLARQVQFGSPEEYDYAVIGDDDKPPSAIIILPRHVETSAKRGHRAMVVTRDEWGYMPMEKLPQILAGHVPSESELVSDN